MHHAFKLVSWDDIVLLGIALSNDCRLGGYRNDERTGLAEALLRAGLVPMSTLSFGGREWGKSREVKFGYLEALVAKTKAEDEQANWLDSLRGEDEIRRNSHEWWEAVVCFSQNELDFLKWESATSGASIEVCPTKGGWLATYCKGHKTSQYWNLFQRMAGNNLRIDELEDLVRPCDCKEQVM